MAVTRSMLKGMGLTDEQVSAIIEEHANTVSGLKSEIERYKADATKLPEVQKELDDLKKGGDDWKDKYEKEHKAFTDYKTEVADKESLAKVQSAYKKLLSDNKVGDRHLDSILKVTDFSKMKLGEDGKLVDEQKLVESIKSDWSGFITTSHTQGADVSTPPAGAGTPKTKEDILKIKDTSERQKAIAENHELFGF